MLGLAFLELFLQLLMLLILSRFLPAPGLYEVRVPVMIIAFITMDIGLVPLIEGLRAEILFSRFEIIGGLRSHLWLLFF